MHIGTIDWFGGLNNKTQTINNYGFITPTGKWASESGIFVHRKDIPSYLESLIEGKGGSGVYVQFNIDANRNSAVDVDLITFIGIVEGLNKERVYINCEEYPGIYLNSSEYFEVGQIVCFGRRYNPTLHRNEAVYIQRIDSLTVSQELLYKVVTSKIPKIFNIFLIQYLNTLTIDQCVEFILNKLNDLDEEERIGLINLLCNQAVNIVIASPELRNLLSIKEYGNSSYGLFIDKYLDSVDDCLRDELIDELIARVRESGNLARSICWKQVKYLQQNLEHRGFLWDIAPTEWQKQAIQLRYGKFFHIVAQFNNSTYPFARSISFANNELRRIDPIDKTLIIKWNPKSASESYIESKMSSARIAEKLVISFYKDMGYVVEDISIHQVTQESKDWVKGDIRLNSRELLDVKNSRKSLNSKVYSEFCVPAFKNHRGEQVKVVGVLSPYFIDSDKERPRVLGDVKKSKLTEIESTFNDRFISISMPRDLESNDYLPHWVFDYDDMFYANQHEWVEKFQDLSDEDVPTWEDIGLISGHNPLPLLIAAKKRLPQDWADNLPQWQVTFINSLINLPVKRISLPYIFLSLLRHFLSMLSYEGSDYSPNEYRRLLYADSQSSHPLRVFDPLDTIYEFCGTLQVLWGDRKRTNLTEFKIFKFRHRGLLTGKRTNEESIATTILAYCGGWVEKKGKCGFTPLVIGKHKTCPACRRLVCPECEYCVDGCSKQSIEQCFPDISNIPF
ncbi:hypothetical protein [Fortiea contorta]|uniref:hypothetical protein n=1 Tax=Fortiea contorta TaxID=1892405 RepID=UPI000347C3F1|nr:hypothetical protein [Fortiea contorta]